MKIVIRKVPERDTSKLECAIGNAIVFNDTNHNGCLWSFTKALEIANDSAIYIQDDMILCRDFVERASEIIGRLPEFVIVFSYPCKASEKERENLYCGFREPFKGGGLLCTYIPNRIREKYLLDKKTGAWKTSDYVARHQLDDVDFGSWLAKHGECIYYVVPNLAGHSYGESVINKNKPKNRLCADFDYNDTEIQWRQK